MTETIKYLFFTGLLIGVGFGIRYGYRYALAGAAYNAKITCSCVFIGGRTLESIQSEDLYTIPFAKQKVDEANKTVTSSILGIISKTSFYRPGLGCTLVNEQDIETMKKTLPDINVAKREYTIPDSLLPSEQQAKIDKTIEWAMQSVYKDVIVNTRAIIVAIDGKIVAERYAPGFNKDSPLMGWSMTKSVTNTMIGILVRDGILKVSQDHLFEEWQNDDRKNITIDHLLRMRSGLEFEENYKKVSDAIKMLYMKDGAGKYAISRPLIHPIGEHWNYSSGTTNILQEVIKSTFTDQKGYAEFPHRRLFAKLGMPTAVMEMDGSGTYIGSSYMYATARDWTKLGLLYQNDGMWNGEQILPPGWVDYSKELTPQSDGEYGAHFWLDPKDNNLPKGANHMLMMGHEGQYVVINPDKKMVVVRLGCTQKSDSFDLGRLLSELYQIF
ncbi:MAG: serine hydrolase [Saprospiraceae bacterium]|nr:serine hydrolase [Saprospiraceae bacterium]